jgi:hypothetical protein
MVHGNFNKSGGNWSSDTINELREKLFFAINERAKIEDLDQRVFTHSSDRPGQDIVINQLRPKTKLKDRLGI